MVAAHALTLRDKLPHSFVIAYADGPFPMAKKIKTAAWRDFVASSTSVVPLRTASFQQLIQLGMSATTGSDAAVLEELAHWVENKTRRAAP